MNATSNAEKQQVRKDLIKHTSIIHCSNSLSLLQRKISNVLLYHAYQSLHENEEHKISIKELCNYLEYRGNNYDAIKQALKVLISTVIEWNLTEDSQKENWTASSILASVNITGAICTYAYSPRMRKLLYSPMMYGKINLIIQSNFTSSYGLALYENCVRYRNVKRTKVFPIELFRKLMGVPENNYRIFRDFKRRVIDKAIEEINTVSDITVKANINRVGNKVNSIYFDVVEREKKKRFSVKIDAEVIRNNDSTSEENKIIKKLHDNFHVDTVNIKILIKTYGVNKISEKINQIESTPSFISGKINNLAGFIIDALKKDYLPPKSSRAIGDENRKIKEKDSSAQKEKKLHDDTQKKQFENYLNIQLKEVIANYERDAFLRIREHFKQYLNETSNMMLIKRFSKDNFSSKVVLVFFRKFLDQYYPNITHAFLTYEQFKDNLNSQNN